MLHIVPKGIGWIEVICGPMFSGKTEELIRRLRRARLRVELRHEVLHRERLRMPAWIPVRIRDHRGHDRRAQVRPLFAERLELVEGHPFGECVRRKLVLQLRHVCAAQSQG